VDTDSDRLLEITSDAASKPRPARAPHWLHQGDEIWSRKPFEMLPAIVASGTQSPDAEGMVWLRFNVRLVVVGERRHTVGEETKDRP